MPRNDSLFKDVLRVTGLFIGGFAGLIIALLIYLAITKTPDADVSLARVDRDTTFYVGKAESTGGGSIRFSMLSTGLLDSPGASVSVGYTNPPALADTCGLRAGRVDSLYQGDFYDDRARITYRHGRVKNGQLRLRIALSYPPKKWGGKPDHAANQR